MQSFRFQPTRWLVVLAIALLGLLTACDLPQVSAEERLFLNLSLDFLGEYRLPKTTVENTPVGGLSAITYDRQRDRFYALSDDRSEYAPARFYTLKLTTNLTNPNASALEKVDVESVTLLKDQAGQTYAKGTLDPEGIALSPQKSVFISSEGVSRDRIPPFISEFDLATGQWRQTLPIPTTYLPDTDGKPPRGIQDNLGFESLTINPGGFAIAGGEPFRLFTATESALNQDLDLPAPDQPIKSRLLHYMVEEGRSLLISEHLYLIDPAQDVTDKHGLTDLLSIDQGGHFLSLERSLTPTGFTAKIFQITTGGATDTNGMASLKGPLEGIEPVRKRLLLDLEQLDIRLDNLEGMTLGARLPDGSQTLVVISDNNFQELQINQFLLFRLKTGA